MADQNQTELLSLKQDFQTVAGNIRVLARLGTGYTGEVYQGALENGTVVAIKAMRPTDSREAQRNFFKEALTLARMRTLENEHGGGHRVAPNLYGADENASPPYIVIEFARGRPLPELLAEAGRLPEAEVLAIGVQLFQTLHLLHTGLDLTYIDLKFEDLMWEREQRTLKLIDWGTLELASPLGISRDLLRGSLFLFRLLTGRALVEYRNIPVQRAADYPEWEQLSWGLQEIMRKMLHRDPSVRLQSAKEIAEAWQNLQTHWNSTPQELLAIARRLTERADQLSESDLEKASSAYREAKTILDICLRLPGSDQPDARRLYERVSQGVQDSSYFVRAYALYRGTSYGPARALFVQGARLYEDATLRRWSQLAWSGETQERERFEAVHEKAKRALDLMEEDQYEMALEVLNRVVADLPDPHLTALRDECQVFVHMEHGRAAQAGGRFGEAAGEYEEANKLWEAIPASGEWAHLVGDLQAQAQKMEIQEKTHGKARQAMLSARQAAELEIILAQWYAAANAVRGRNDEVFEALKAHSQQFLAAGKPEWAARILDVGKQSPFAPEYTANWDIPAQVQLGVEQGPLGLAAAAVGKFKGHEAELERRISDTLLEKHLEAALAAGDVERARAIADIGWIVDAKQTQTRWEPAIAAREEELLSRRRESVDRMLNEVNQRLGLEQPEELLRSAEMLSMTELSEWLQPGMERLQECERILAAAARVADPEYPRLAEIEAWQQKVKIYQERVANQLNEKRADFQQQMGESQAHVARLLENAGHLERAAQALLAAQALEHRQEVLVDLVRHLTEALQVCRSVQLDIDPESEWAQQNEAEILERIQALGMLAWDELARHGALADLPPAALQQADEALQAGQASLAAAVVASIEANLNSVKKRTALALSVMRWEAEHEQELCQADFRPDFVRRITQHAVLGLPACYWQDSPSSAYIHRMNETLLQQWDSVHPDREVEFLQSVQCLVWVNNLSHRLELLASSVSMTVSDQWDLKDVLNKLYLTAQTQQGAQSGVVGVLERLPIFSDPEQQSARLNGELFKAVKAEAAAVRQDQGRRRRNFILSTAGLLIVLGLLGFGAWLFRDRLFTPGEIPPTLIVAAATNTPSVTPSFTATDTPAPTQALTDTPMPTPVTPSATISPTDTPLPLPTSSYVVTNTLSINPSLPGPAQQVVLLNNESSVLTDPPLSDRAAWTLCSVASGTTQNDDAYLPRAAGSATWTADVPFEPGWYEIFVLDTIVCSTVDLEFRVKLNGEVQPPLLGANRVAFLGSQTAPVQAEPGWKSIGIYQFDRPGLLTVSTAWETTSTVNPIAIDRVLIVRLPSHEQGLVGQLRPERPAFILDDLSASLSPGEGWQAAEAPYAWGGRYQYLTNPLEDVSVTWLLPGKVTPGKYVLFARIPPEHATAPVEFTLLVNDQAYELLLGQTLALNQGAWAGKDEWTQIGPELEIIPANEPLFTLALQMKVPANTLAEIAVDAVAFIQVP